jgi:hypothetical protein
MTLCSLIVLRLVLPCSLFLMTLLALLIFTNIGILAMMRLKTLSFAKARNLLTVNFNIFSWFLVVP